MVVIAYGYKNCHSAMFADQRGRAKAPAAVAERGVDGARECNCLIVVDHADPTVRLMARKVLWTLHNYPWRGLREAKINAYLREAQDALGTGDRKRKVASPGGIYKVKIVRA